MLLTACICTITTPEINLSVIISLYVVDVFDDGHLGSCFNDGITPDFSDETSSCIDHHISIIMSIFQPWCHNCSDLHPDHIEFKSSPSRALRISKVRNQACWTRDWRIKVTQKWQCNRRMIILTVSWLYSQTVMVGHVVYLVSVSLLLYRLSFPLRLKPLKQS